MANHDWTSWLHLGDYMDILPSLPDDLFHLTVTSPPYDNMRTYDGFLEHFAFEPLARELYRTTRPGGVVVWVVNDATIDGSETGTSFRQTLFFMDLGFNLHDTMIYHPSGTGAKGSHKCYWQAFEYMFVFSKGKIATVNRIRDRKNKYAGRSTVGGRIAADGSVKDTRKRIIPSHSVRTNIWKYNVGNNNGDDKVKHPAPFPEALARDHILSWSREGDIVLDPMMGSGTVGKMATLTGRRFMGIEIVPEHFAEAEDRIEHYAAQARQPALIGRTHD